MCRIHPNRWLRHVAKHVGFKKWLFLVIVWRTPLFWSFCWYVLVPTCWVHKCNCTGLATNRLQIGRSRQLEVDMSVYTTDVTNSRLMMNNYKSAVPFGWPIIDRPTDWRSSFLKQTTIVTPTLNRQQTFSRLFPDQLSKSNSSISRTEYQLATDT